MHSLESSGHLGMLKQSPMMHFRHPSGCTLHVTPAQVSYHNVQYQGQCMAADFPHQTFQPSIAESSVAKLHNPGCRAQSRT